MKTPGKASDDKSSDAAKKTSSTGTGPNSLTSKSSTSTDGGLRHLFEDQLKDIYWAEKALTKALPIMMENASSQDLIDALESHLSITEQQVTRCEEIFAALKRPAEAHTCDAMQGLIKEANAIMASTTAGNTRDAGIIAASQKIEHYEIATYGSLVTWARQLHEFDIANMLEETLSEEREADDTLCGLADSNINQHVTTSKK